MSVWKIVSVIWGKTERKTISDFIHYCFSQFLPLISASCKTSVGSQNQASSRICLAKFFNAANSSLFVFSFCTENVKVCSRVYTCLELFLPSAAALIMGCSICKDVFLYILVYSLEHRDEQACGTYFLQCQKKRHFRLGTPQFIV